MTVNMSITRNGDYVEFCDDCETGVRNQTTHVELHRRLGKAVSAE